MADGAHDDGAGVVQAIEAVRVLKAVGIRPKRSIRVVLYMSEEFGGIGGEEYAKQAQAKNEMHYAAMESDAGGFLPLGFSGPFSEAVKVRLKSWATYLKPTGATAIFEGEGGTDIEPLCTDKTLCFGLQPVSTHYFDYHHSALDRFSAVKKDELHAGAGALAILAYLLAETSN